MTSAPPKPDPLLFGRFRADRVLGEGTLAVVRRAADQKHGGYVALKLPKPDVPFGHHRLRDEYRARRGLHHPNLVAVRELVEDDEDVALVEEWVDGPPLRVATSSPESLVRIAEQLIDALSALHQSGRVHGDVTPDNILLRDADTPVLIDFDLSWSHQPLSWGPPEPSMGSAGYTAPEVLQGSPPSAATDLFSLGVVLWEACSNRRLFDGEPAHITAQTLSFSLSEALGRLPGDLPKALRDLLGRLLGPPQARSPQPVSAPGPQRFFGREAELERLVPLAASAAFTAVEIRGVSGSGKTRLVQEVLYAANAVAPGLVWTSTCHPTSLVPFRGIHEWVESLGRFLHDHPLTQEGQEVELALADLSALFPKLIPPKPDPPHPTPRTVRAVESAASAFATLTGLIARDLPLRLWMDDAQWRDPAASLFLEAIRRSGAPGVSMWVSRRPDPRPSGFDVVVHLGDLPEQAVHQWASSVGRQPPVGVGSAFLLSMVFSSPDALETEPQALLARRLQSQSLASREILRCVAVSANPVGWLLLQRLGLSDAAAIEALLGAGLVQIVLGDSGPALAPAHDQIRQAVLSQLSDPTSEHIALGHALIATGADASAIAHHLTRGGDPSAPAWWHRAAQASFDRSAWSTAVRWYQHMEENGQSSHTHRLRIAEALTHLGLTNEAVDAWIRVADKAPDEHAMVQARVAGAAVRFGSGDVQAALGVVRHAARTLRMRLPHTWVGATLQTLWWMARHAVAKRRGLPPRPATEAERLRLALGWTVAGALGSLEGTLGSGLHARFSFEADRFGTDADRARAWGVGLTYRLGGGPDPRLTRDLVAQTEARVEACETTEERTVLHWALGYALFTNGLMRQAEWHMRRGAAGFAEIGHTGWEREHAERHIGWVQRYRGDFRSMCTSAHASLALALRTGNRASEHQTRAGLRAYWHLLQDDPEACGAEVAAVRGEVGPSGAFGTRYLLHHTEMLHALYVGDAHAVIDGVPKMLRTDFHLRFLLHGRLEGVWNLALAGWLRGDRAATERALRALSRERSRWAEAARVALAACQARDADAAKGYRRAGGLYDDLGMHAYADACRAHAFAAEGHSPTTNPAMRSLSDRGILRPTQWLRAAVPGPATQPLDA